MTFKGGFRDGNNQSVKSGDRVEYRFGARRGVLVDAMHDGDAWVNFDDKPGTETVKWHHLCKIPDTWPTNDREWARGAQLELPGIPSPPLVPMLPDDDQVNPKTIIGARRVDLSLLPAAGIIHGAHAMMDGAAKYGPYNWREKKVPARTYVAAAMRHLADFLDGEETATDSGVHHLGHVIGCCAIVLDAMETGNLIDDRPSKGAAPAILARLEAAILARQAPKSNP